MKIFERDEKINFVDDYNVFVGFDYSPCCCEHYGWTITKECPTNDIDLTKLVTDPHLDFSLYRFDTTFYKIVINELSCDTGVGAIFRLINGNIEELFLTLWNYHNGYYTHGFEMCEGETKLFVGHI